MQNKLDRQEIVLVEHAQTGDRTAFEKLVVRYQRRMYGYVLSLINISTEVDDIVQDTFLKAYSKLHTLRDASLFSQWLYRICKNSVYAYLRKKQQKQTQELSCDAQQIDLINQDSHITEQAREEWTNYFDSLRVAIGMLRNELKQVIQLKYFTDFSYQEIAMLCGIEVKRVKSRLFEARKKIKEYIPLLYQGIEYTPDKLQQSKENIMQSIDRISNASYVFERLSLFQQIALCQIAKRSGRFDELMLAEMNRIDGGVEYVAQYNATITLPELVDILTYVDDYTKMRVFNKLEEADPELAESLKQNMFIFDDIILFDIGALQLLIKSVDPLLLQTALSHSSPQVREHFLQVVPDAEKEDWIENIWKRNPYAQDVRQAQYLVIQTCYSLVEKEQVRIKRDATGVVFSVVD